MRILVEQAITLIAIAGVLFLLQWFLSAKIKKIKYLPLFLLVAGLIFCFVVYFGKFGSNSSSVIAENQYFATFLAVPLIAGLAGCVLGHLFTILKR